MPIWIVTGFLLNVPPDANLSSYKSSSQDRKDHKISWESDCAAAGTLNT